MELQPIASLSDARLVFIGLSVQGGCDDEGKEGWRGEVLVDILSNIGGSAFSELSVGADCSPSLHSDGAIVGESID